MRERRAWLRMIGLALSACLLVASMGGADAFAAETHVFEPVLSLTGGCGVSELDPVPDPAAPPCPAPEPACPSEPVGSHPPSGCFNAPAGIATDAYGNIYVASAGPEQLLGKEGRIDVFDSAGFFITEVKDENGPGDMAVDSEGNLYVTNRFPEHSEVVVRYEPTLYEPDEGKIEYGKPPAVLVPKTELGVTGIAVDRTTDHVFVPLSENSTNHVNVYKSAAEGNVKIEEFGAEFLDGFGIAVDVAHNRIYLNKREGPPGETEQVVNVLELSAPHAFLFRIKDTALPAGNFLSPLSLAVDEGTEHLFVYDGAAKKVYEFDQSGQYIKTIEHGFKNVFQSQITVDNGELSPNGALNPKERFLYVPSNPGGIGHSYAFGPELIGEPEVKSVSFANVGESEAELQAAIEPFGLQTHYVFQYTTVASFEANEWSVGAQTAGEGEIPAGLTPIDVSAAVTGLAPGTAYRFRVTATNAEGSDEGEATFATYPAAVASPSCPNDPFRTGLSALLPDCRAYELVTPPDTNARTPRGVGVLSPSFVTRQASPEGNAVSFFIEGGTLPGGEGVGTLAGDPYLSSRGEGGWGTSYVGPNGAEAGKYEAGGTSSDQGYYFLTVSGGTAVVEGKDTTYVHYPDGHASLIGRGSLTADPRAQGNFISSNAGHIIFNSFVQLESNAPEDGTRAVYDRTPDEVTHVVSLLPGNEPQAAGESAVYLGSSLDGRGVAFRIGSTLYLRVDDQETYELGDVGFAGVAEGGNRAFYVEGGDLYRFDSQTGITTPFTTAGNVIPVNVSADGSTAYFVSPTALPTGPNPRGEEPAAGGENLYRSREGTVAFVGTVTKGDVEGEGAKPGGLGFWEQAAEGSPGNDPSRTTADGNVFLFESRAGLTGYEPDGHAQVYRYDAATNSLDCLSCNPTLAPSTGDASLQSIAATALVEEPFSASAYVENLTAGGQRAVFQSPDPLVPGDTDGLLDVYEWEANGTGTCTSPGGCLYLLSSGHSEHTDYLYAVSDGGNDVFFRTGDLLLPRDSEETPSIYDARVGGGFPEPVEAECQGEGCRGGLTSAPSFPSPASAVGGPSGNVNPKKACPKGKRKVRRHGKTVCVKKHHKHKHQKTASKKKGAGK